LFTVSDPTNWRSAHGHDDASFDGIPTMEGADVGLEDFAWIVWLGLILIFLVVEIFTVDFTFLMLAIGSLGGLVASLFGVPWPIQLVIAGVVSLLLIFAVRPPLLRRLRRGEDPAKSNVDALLGLRGTVIAGFDGKVDHMKLSNGETWTIKPLDATTKLAIGDIVAVSAIDGATAVVVPIERTAQ
jgi:membrane protein implicated in regulation of membrane protease activity